MTVYVLRNGEMVVKGESRNGKTPSSFPCPMISRFDSFASPITGENISSWRQRDADMQAGGAVDPRDLAKAPFEERAATNARYANVPAEWGDPD